MERRRRRTDGTQGEAQHVVNPATNRVEQLALSNALLRQNPGDAGRRGPDDGFEQPMAEQPINVDITGMPRGRCRGCERCDGYVRQDRPAENQNDLEVLRCRRCGCQAHEHEGL